MKEFQKVAIAKIEKLNAEYKKGGLSRKVYLDRHRRLANAAKDNATNRMKADGVKVEREFGGYYIYRGINFTIGINSAACETEWWEANIYAECNEGVTDEIAGTIEEYNTFNTKAEVLSYIYQLDKGLSEK